MKNIKERMRGFMPHSSKATDSRSTSAAHHHTAATRPGSHPERANPAAAGPPSGATQVDDVLAVAGLTLNDAPAPRGPNSPAATALAAPKAPARPSAARASTAPVALTARPDALMALLEAGKGKQALARSAAWFIENGFVNDKTGKLQTLKLLLTPRSQWLMGRTAFRGGYGKVHLARMVLADGVEPLRAAIKEQRLVAKADTGTGRKTAPRSKHAIRAEMRDFIAVRDQIEDELAAIRAQRGASDSLRLVCAHARRTVVYDAHHDRAKNKDYMVMTLELGDTQRLLPYMDKMAEDRPETLRTLAASFATQTFLELTVLHGRCRKAHLDIKLENVTFDEHGRFKLMDFGLARDLDAHNRTDRAGLRAGTLLAPEMLLAPAHAADPEAPLDRAGSATDVHALALTVLDLVAGYDVDTPALKPIYGTDVFDDAGALVHAANEVDIEAAVQRLMAIDRFVADVARHPSVLAGLRDPERREAILDGAFPGELRWLADYFDNCLARAPELTLAMLPALRNDPLARPSAFQVARRAWKLLPPEETHATRSVLRFFAEHPARKRYDEAFAEMDRYLGLLRKNA